MALSYIAGMGPLLPRIGLPATAGYSGITIDATGEIIALPGRVWWPGVKTGTKNISRVGFRFSGVTKAGGSALTVSLQDVSLTAGPPTQPDGVQDQTVAIANANASFVSNTWIRTAALSASRTVSYADRLAVVIEFDGAGRLGADTVSISAVSAAAFIIVAENAPVLFAGGVWTAQTNSANVILEFDDGTFGILDGSIPTSDINTHAYNSGTGTADEHALAFQVSEPVVVDGIYALVAPAASGDFELILYSGTSVLVAVAIDANAITQTAAARYYLAPIAEQTLSPGTQYYVAVRPTTANNVSAFSLDVNDANHFTCMDGGLNFNYATRLNQGSWAAITSTRRLYAGVRISQIHDGAGGAGIAVLTGGGLAR
jgi:hypothetical protein